MKVSLRRRWKQFWCKHEASGRTGYEGITWEYLPAGWYIQGGIYWSPLVCTNCGYVDLPEEGPYAPVS